MIVLPPAVLSMVAKDLSTEETFRRRLSEHWFVVLIASGDGIH